MSDDETRPSFDRVSEAARRAREERERADREAQEAQERAEREAAKQLVAQIEQTATEIQASLDEIAEKLQMVFGDESMPLDDMYVRLQAAQAQLATVDTVIEGTAVAQSATHSEPTADLPFDWDTLDSFEQSLIERIATLDLSANQCEVLDLVLKDRDKDRFSVQESGALGDKKHGFLTARHRRRQGRDQASGNGSQAQADGSAPEQPAESQAQPDPPVQTPPRRGPKPTAPPPQVQQQPAPSEPVEQTDDQQKPKSGSKPGKERKQKPNPDASEEGGALERGFGVLKAAWKNSSS